MLTERKAYVATVWAAAAKGRVEYLSFTMPWHYRHAIYGHLARTTVDPRGTRSL